MINRFIFFLAFFSSSIFLLSAQNLVPNPSFESIMCPSVYTGYSPQVETQVENWYSANCASPDPMTDCSTDDNTNVPDVWFGEQTARTGTNYMGFSFYDLLYEYLQVELTEPLQSGQEYEVSFYLSCADEVQFASDAVGAYLSASPNTCDNPAVISGSVFDFVPQVQTSNFVTERVGWQLISGTFTAVGGERYLTLGCYEPWAETSKFDFGSGDPRCYYYLDDVRVAAVADNPLAIGQIALSAKIVSPYAVELDWEIPSTNAVNSLTIERSTDGSKFVPVARLEDTTRRHFRDANLNNQTLYYYRLAITTAAGVSYSTVASVPLPQTFLVEVFPNPIQDVLYVKNEEEKMMEISIFNTVGQVVLSRKVAANTTATVDFEMYPVGVYLVKINGQQGKLLLKK